MKNQKNQNKNKMNNCGKNCSSKSKNNGTNKPEDCNNRYQGDNE